MEYFGKNENIFLHLRTVAIINGATREGSRQLNTLYYSYTNNLMSFPPSHSAIQCVQQPLLQFQCYNFRTLRIRRVRQCDAACRRLVHSLSTRVWQGVSQGSSAQGGATNWNLGWAATTAVVVAAAVALERTLQ